MSKVFYTRHDGGLTLFRDGRHATVSSSHPNFAAILVALNERRYDDVVTLMNVSEAINLKGVSRKFQNRKVFVRDGEVFWTDSHHREHRLDGTLVDRIIKSLGKPGGDKYADALLKLMDNIKRNTEKAIAPELYDWFASGEAPITDDGCFLAYKKVRSDFKDIYTGTMDNSPGSVPRMKQDDVDRDRHNHCSVGLHFCSRSYLSSYGSADNCKVVIVKVNPRHVFAIPTDYSFQKGRASEYFVVGEYKGDWKTNEAFKSSFVDEDTKLSVMPEVAFAGWLRPSLESLARSFDLVGEGVNANGVWLDKGIFIVKKNDRMIPVKKNARGEWIDILGTPVGGAPELMSIETKSVREALKKAIAKVDKSGKS